MANRHRGQASFEADGKTWLVSFSANALCELEDVLDMRVSEIAEAMGDPKGMRLKTARAVFWAGLQDNHPEVDVKAAGNLMTGRIPEAMGVVGRAFALAFPEATAGADVDPPKPGQDGTGPAS